MKPATSMTVWRKGTPKWNWCKPTPMDTWAPMLLVLSINRNALVPINLNSKLLPWRVWPYWFYEKREKRFDSGKGPGRVSIAPEVAWPEGPLCDYPDIRSDSAALSWADHWPVRQLFMSKVGRKLQLPPIHAIAEKHLKNSEGDLQQPLRNKGSAEAFWADR